MEERRQHERVSPETRFEARLCAADGADGKGQVMNLSNAGAFVATDLEAEVGTRLRIYVEVPGLEREEPLQAMVMRKRDAIEGRRRTIPAGLGIVFVAEHAEERAFIQKAVLVALGMDLERMEGGA